MKYPSTFEMESCSAIFSAMGLAGSIFQFFSIDHDLHVDSACAFARAFMLYGHVHVPSRHAARFAVWSGLVWSVFYTLPFSLHLEHPAAGRLAGLGGVVNL